MPISYSKWDAFVDSDEEEMLQRRLQRRFPKPLTDTRPMMEKPLQDVLDDETALVLSGDLPDATSAKERAFWAAMRGGIHNTT